MPHIIVKLGMPLQQAVGQRRLVMTMPPEATVADLVAALQTHYPALSAAFADGPAGGPTRYILFLNSRPVTPPNYAGTPLPDDAVVHLVLPVVGGSCG